MRAQAHRVLPLSEAPRLHQPEELLAAAKLTVTRGAQHINRVAVAIDDRAEMRRQTLARLRRLAITVAIRTCQQLPVNWTGYSVEYVVIRPLRIQIERIDLRAVD